MSVVARLAPGVLVSAAMAGLALLLDHGRARGVPLGVLEAAGVVYFALLVGAPLGIDPWLWRRGASGPWRAGVSLLPAGLWWLTEVRFRLRGHTLPEALWLAASPVNALHLWLLLVELGLAELACRAVARLRAGRGAVHAGPPGAQTRALSRRRPWRAAVAVGAALVAPFAVVASFPAYLEGYRALFQEGLLPAPAALPGPVPAGLRPVAGRRPPPNVIVILSDDHRVGASGHEGHPFVETPALDRLAREGVRFRHATVPSSLCSPSRASLLTGTLPERHGVWNNFTPWSDGNRTWLEYLKRAGYDTAFIGKWHMPGRLPELRGVDHFVTFTAVGGQGVYEDCPLVVDGREEPSRERYIARELTDRAIAWIRSHGDGPFALHLAHKNVHAPFTPAPAEAGRYAGRAVALPPEAHPWSGLTEGQYVHLNPLPLDDAIRRYAEAIGSMDREIGRLLEALDELGLAGDTWVVYTSDNGYLWGEHGAIDKRWAWEESMRVPLIVRAPGASAPPGAVVDRLVSNVDLAPTLLELAGLAPAPEMQGASLLPLLADPQAPFREALTYRYLFEPPYPVPTIRALRTERYKLVEREDRGTALYDLATDPHERHDRADDPAFAALRARLASRLAGAVLEARP